MKLANMLFLELKNLSGKYGRENVCPNRVFLLSSSVASVACKETYRFPQAMFIPYTLCIYVTRPFALRTLQCANRHSCPVFP